MSRSAPPGGNNAEPSWGQVAIPLAGSELTRALTQVGGLKGVKIEFKVVDSANDPVIAVARATELVRTDGVKALITDTSQNSVAVNRLHVRQRALSRSERRQSANPPQMSAWPSEFRSGNNDSDAVALIPIRYR